MIEPFLRNCWESYTKLAPSAQKIKDIFESNGETVVNDHVAFRTVDFGALSLSNIQGFFFDMGYKIFDSYLFKEKKLFANAYIHEKSPEKYPKIFLSGLQWAYFSEKAQEILLDGMACQVSGYDFTENLLHSGIPWEPLAMDDYKILSAESEYAAWVGAHGLVPNHFTVSVNHLKKTPTIVETLDLVESHGFALNLSGGRVKGSKNLFLEQGSTMAEKRKTEFFDGTMVIPTCYYEFAHRYPMADGTLYQGFVEGSADKIFESTNKE